MAVRALVLPKDDLKNLRESDSEIVEGDIRDLASLRPAMRDVDTVVHLAAISRHVATVPDDDYMQVNVEGTRNVLEAAEEAGVRRVLFTGTIEAVGMSRDGSALTEETPQTPRNVYGRSKLEAEDLVRGFNADHRLETVVVRPPMTYGPRELLLCQRMFRIVQYGVYPLIGSGEALCECCFVKNQVHGIRLAAERGKPGEVYFISDERSYALREVVDAIGEALGVRVRKPRIPVPAAWALGLTMEGLSKVFRFYPFLVAQTGRPPFSRKTVAWTSESRLYVDIGKARRELGYAPRYTLAQGMRETVDWYRAHGCLKPARER